VSEKAEAFRRMHHDGLLVLPNAWDVGSAQALAALPGCRALATSSGAVARSLGYEDHENISRAEMLEVVRRIAAAVEVPVTADLEAGYGDPAGTAALALEAGAVGMNLEDSVDRTLFPVDRQVETIRAVRAAAPALVLNARVDVFLLGGGVDEAVERGNAYLEAGADCVYPIFASAREDIEGLVRGIGGPVNVLLSPKAPPVPELAALGVARATWGSGLASAALAEAARIAGTALESI
jgi:2-methylisocitrate lyase-like PEP mutase family enzyme